MSSPDLIELALSDLDETTSETVATVFDRWGWGGAVLEQIIDEQGAPHSTLKTYVAATEEERVRKIEIDLAREMLGERKAAIILDGVLALKEQQLRRRAARE